MGFFDFLKGGKKQVTEDSVEFSETQEPREMLTIRIESVASLGDVERVAAYLRRGNILLIKIKELQRKDIGLAQTTLQKMKRISTQFNWDLVALPEGYLIMTPNFARIERPEM